jgi:Translationally controlled tumour protein
MRVFKDIISGDEMVSDSYPQTTKYEDAVLEVKSRLTTKGQEDFGISSKLQVPQSKVKSAGV